MALSSGFFNSVGNDRLYDATDFANFLDGVVENGVYPHDTGMLIVPNDDPIGSNPPSIKVKAGKAYLNGYWVVNSADMTFNLADAQTTVPNTYFIVYLEFDLNDTGRTVSLKSHSTTTSLNEPIPTVSGKYNLVLGKVANRIGSNPIQADITDQRTFAGITPVINAGSLPGSKIEPEGISHTELGLAAVETVNVKNQNITLEKLAAGFYIPNVTAAINLGTAGGWAYGAATAAITTPATGNYIAIITAGIYDQSTAGAPTDMGTLNVGFAWSIDGGAFTNLSIWNTSAIISSDGSVSIQYPIQLLPNKTYIFKVRGMAGTNAQNSTYSYIFGVILPR